MTTPINTLEDILNALERDPALREALRRHILTDELLQMPVRLERIEADVSTLKDNLTTLTTTVNRIGGDVSMLKGSDYESHVARFANRFLHRQLGVAATIFSSQRNQAALATLLDDAETQGNINAHETDELDKTDLILTDRRPHRLHPRRDLHNHPAARRRPRRPSGRTARQGHRPDRHPIRHRHPGRTRLQPPRRPDHPHTRTHRRLNPAGGNSGNQSFQNAI